MDIRRPMALLAPSLALFLLVSSSVKASGSCETFASSNRVVDCTQPVHDGLQLCSQVCGGSWQDTHKIDGTFHCVREKAINGAYPCEILGEPVMVPGDLIMEHEWIFENVPEGVQTLVVKAYPSCSESFDFWYNINTVAPCEPGMPLTECDLCQSIAFSDLDCTTGPDVTAQLASIPLEEGRYRIRVFDDPRPNHNCSDVEQADDLNVDLIKIVTTWDQFGIPDTMVNDDFQTGPGTVLTPLEGTLISDNTRQLIKESLSGGVSKLSHTWSFNGVPIGCFRLVVEGHRTSNTEGDNFQFSWAPDVDGVPGTFQDIPGALISQTSDTTVNVPFSTSLSGTIYIRVKDTNQTSGTFRDTLKIDFLAIRAQ